ncbi:MAG: cellulose biosynthesis cyclic di-GMP-binding regulatory protein BcsB, partial [Anaerolineae bacterium]|nr:cellulose biosynthesis cyclic di-GMP-binding regulatory protein BcsB [Anaerolineae bacterium]
MKMLYTVRTESSMRALSRKLSGILWLWLWVLGAVLLFPSDTLAQAGQTWEITLKELGFADEVLKGPIDQARYYFGLPANWLPQSGTYLQLNLEYAASGQDQYIAGLLSVRLNNEVLHTYNLGQTNHLSLTIDIPPHVLRLFENQQINQLQLDLEVYEDCDLAVLTSLTVRSASLLHFRYNERPLLLDLALYPKPLFQSRAFEPSGVRFVLPDEPTWAEIQTAAIIAARLGQLTDAGINFTVSTAAEISSLSAYTEHLFIIGAPERNPLIRQFPASPVSLAERQLKLFSELPCSVTPQEPFSYTLVLQNTTTRSQRLFVKDRWPAGVSLLDCAGACEITAANLLTWDVGDVGVGEVVSLTVQAHLNIMEGVPPRLEHTASLVDQQGQFLNEDTLAAQVTWMPDSCRLTSSETKSRFFFATKEEAVPEYDGVVQEFALAPLSKYAVIVVTGLDDQAVLRAGQALGNKAWFPGMVGTYAIVQDAQVLVEENTPPVEDTTLEALGYVDQVFNVSGTESTSYYFRVLRGWSIMSDAALFLHFAHGVALNPLSSTLEIDLNRIPIYSVHLNERNVQNTWVEVPLPSELLLPGSNRLGFQLSGAFPDCVPPQYLRGLWLTVFANSFLHLPYGESEDFTLDLNDFPQPFNDSRGLSEVAFSLSAHPTNTELQGMLNLGAYFGSSVSGDYFSPRVLLGGCPVSETLTAQHLVAIGRPTENCYISTVNDLLPQPFISGTNEIYQQVDNVIYRLPPAYSLGYIQELTSPWAPARALMVVTGSTDEGVGWALNALVNGTLNYQLKGNLSILVQKDMLRTTDTRI